MAWSPFQEAIFAAIESPAPADRHIVIEALAGSGKTTTAIEGMARTPASKSATALAFNRPIADELKRKVPEGVEAATFHSFGLRALTRRFGRFAVEPDKVQKMVRSRLGRRYEDRPARRAVERCVDLAKNSLLEDAAELDAAADAVGVDFPEDRDRGELIGHALDIVSECLTPERDGVIDYTDMLWLPIVRQVPIEARDFIFVDEGQDLNEAQLAMVARATKVSSGRLIAIGDSRQAIYGFRGADGAALNRIAMRFEARQLSLPITYRCDLAIVREARKIVPELQPRPDAGAGAVAYSSTAELQKLAVAGDMIISRTNAPLIALALRFIAAGKRCQVRGKQIGDGLIAWIRARKARTVEDLQAAIEKWALKEIARLKEADRDLGELQDRAACLRALCAGASNVDEVIMRASSLFDDSDATPILLTSTHRAKGLEADRVFLLRSTYAPARSKEESNLLYVAITRAKKELIYVYDRND